MEIRYPTDALRNIERISSEQTSVVAEFAYNMGWCTACSEIKHRNNAENNLVMCASCNKAFPAQPGSVQRCPLGCGYSYTSLVKNEIQYPNVFDQRIAKALLEQTSVVAEYAFELGWDTAIVLVQALNIPLQNTVALTSVQQIVNTFSNMAISFANYPFGGGLVAPAYPTGAGSAGPVGTAGQAGATGTGSIGTGTGTGTPGTP